MPFPPRARVSCLALAAAGLFLVAARSEDGAAAGALEVTYLANEGFLLKVDETEVLIDAFVTVPYAGYAALTDDDRAALLAARAPFDSVELALVSHVHGDHFQPAPARAFLEQSRDTHLWSSARVVDELGLAEADALAEQVHTLVPPTGETRAFEHAGVAVELWRLRHAGGEDDGLQNLGHKIRIGGHTVLHVGDAAMDAELFAPYAGDGEPVDVALVPYWYWQADAGRALLEGPLRARHTVAVHVPPHELAEVVEGLGLDFPGVGVPQRARQSWTVARR